MGLSAIAIASTGYGFFLLQSPLDSTTIPITAIVSVCIVLGFTQIMLGYEFRNLQHVIFGRNASPRQSGGILESAASGASSHYPPIIIGNEQPLDDFKNTLDPARVSESERRLEGLRKAMRRVAPPNQERFSESEGKQNPTRGRRTRPGGVNRDDSASERTRFHVSMVGRTQIVLSAVTTGEEVKLRCDSSEVLETAWRAFAKGEKVRVMIQDGRIIRLEPA